MKRALLLGIVISAGSLILSFGKAEAVKPSFSDRVVAAGTQTSKGESGIYNFDKAHTNIGFKIKHMGIAELRGFFRDFSGKINYDANDVTKSSVEFTAKVTSVDTGVDGRDNHLRNADFFEVEKYPDITFKSTKVTKKGDDLILTGDFTMKGVTKSISFDFDINGFLPANQRKGMTMGISADTEIDRYDYGVNYGKDRPGPGIANMVDIELEIEAFKDKAPEAAAETADKK